MKRNPTPIMESDFTMEVFFCEKEAYKFIAFGSFSVSSS